MLEHTHRALNLIPGVEVLPIESGCCGMAGSFGYEAEHYGISMKMAEQLLPAVRAADVGAAIVADGIKRPLSSLFGTARDPDTEYYIQRPSIAGSIPTSGHIASRIY